MRILQRIFTVATYVLIVSLTLIQGAFALTPIEDFAKAPEFLNAIVSPSGKYLAVERSADEGKTMVAMLRTKDLKLAGYLPATTDVSPYQPVWINDERLVVHFTQEFGRREYESLNGEMMAINANGKIKRKIISHQQFVNGEGLNALHGFANFEHLLPNEKDTILIRFIEFKSTRIGVKPKLYKINTKTGRVKLVTEAETYHASFTYSSDGEPKYSLGIMLDETDELNKLVAHKFDGESWHSVDDIGGALGAETLEIVAESVVENEVYIQASYLDSTDKIFKYNLATGSKELVFHHPGVDPRWLDIDPYTNRLIAVHFEYDQPDIAIISPEHLYARWYPALLQYFPDSTVRITSATEAGDQLVVHTSGATDPGKFYLFDTKAKKMRPLFAAMSWIEEQSLSAVTAVNFESRDGKKLSGYLTRPKDGKVDAPLVVMPHGGPHGVRDWWQYDSDVQFLASRGYAVMQINFRGSGGYGDGFELAGYRKWGSDIQHDIIDASRWAASQEGIDSDRICIVGASFGGYSALMSPTIEPDLFKCAVGLVGVYDLNLMWTTADIRKRKLGKNYLYQAIGRDKQDLEAFSPLDRILKLKAPVFLAHGKMDWRVDVKHFKKMSAALKKKGHPLETLLIAREGHGFADEKNRSTYLQRLEQFLEKYIGQPNLTN